MKLVVCLAVAGALAIVAGGEVAHAQSARCLVRSIHAQHTGAGVDARLGELSTQLTRPPFTEWKSFKLLAEHDLPLAPGASATFDLPEGRTGSLTYKEHLQPQGGKHRVRLQLEVKKGDKLQLSTVLVLDEGGTVLTAGQKFEDGMLILGVSCSTH